MYWNKETFDDYKLLLIVYAQIITDSTKRDICTFVTMSTADWTIQMQFSARPRRPPTLYNNRRTLAQIHHNWVIPHLYAGDIFYKHEYEQWARAVSTSDNTKRVEENARRHYVRRTTKIKDLKKYANIYKQP